MKAILVRYHGATNTLGARLSVHAEGVKTKFYSRQYDDNLEVQSKACAIDFCTKLGWLGVDRLDHTLVGGTLPNGDDVYVFNNS